MEIVLTRVQWNSLKVMVDQGRLAEMQLGLPIETRISQKRNVMNLLV